MRWLSVKVRDLKWIYLLALFNFLNRDKCFVCKPQTKFVNTSFAKITKTLRETILLRVVVAR